ncbi:hypothetical protein CO112_01560 [Candidatus Dojkabacteria bacterium CG_4_9_14_3_um_filter_150_Dojkabacteria_WS6_41_13]|uniref:ATP-grasp domain-containing protein n=1 Tax=Candidatus Dojkabacteria bacterium CG_4_10_14_0_2_um_filter_Dojkabacteria_WS6_41_15 TaxID=2014249 RepID=A0A2M7W2Q6_9BACT|nr:MAG: hypothetical protein COZ14_03245 [Candidatus Dojkabacteria bacterium CG_4_10_14_3_um_filter_Dojkabacteria_WS6_41_9]PJA15138.1 MAG: hypothetical protein COX64_01100 [Candidatus Dojkabacteria bacterium CG_4_10_14_0_2_um_filter_Dojkabacteria_WS6_41_15]PJB23044.1 MAG: hypothetical protein CO112_01560 [Candidatus Dojkabacteria bacterium CG_4_9_14_3_um_filter_150_Dojkabacteria_WS6_41_13]
MKRPTVLVFNPPMNFGEVKAQLLKKSRLIRGFYRNVEVIISKNDIRFLIKGVDLRDFDYVWVTGSWSKRDLAYAISLYLTHHKRPHTVVNEGAGSTKLVDMTLFALAGMAQPRSYYCSRNEYTRRAEGIATVCKFPLIAKDVKGTFGRNSFIAHDLKELKEKLFQTDEYTDFIFQEYIENDFDWGVIVGNDRVLSAEKSYRKKDDTTFMNHASGGATEVFVPTDEVPTKIKEMAIKASKLLNLSWARSDILVNSKTGVHYILETNRSPRMTSKSTEVTAFVKYINSITDKD